MTFRVKSGGAYVDLDPNLRRWVEKAVARTLPVTQAKLKESGEKLYREAYSGWPVKSGRSRDQLFQHVEVKDLARLELVLGCEAEYSYYITERWPSTKKVWIKLLKTPVRKEYERLSTELVEELATKIKP